MGQSIYCFSNIAAGCAVIVHINFVKSPFTGYASFESLYSKGFEEISFETLAGIEFQRLHTCPVTVNNY